MAKPKITLYMDVVSPFAYIAYYALRHLSTFSQCEIEYVPIFLGGLMKSCNNTPPLFIKNKGTWIRKERTRWSKYFNVPMKDGIPPGFPMNTILIQRALIAIDMKSPEKLTTVIDAVYEAVWTQHEDIRETAVVASILSRALGEKDAEAAMEGAQAADVKKKLSDNTEMAFNNDAFGLPWFQCTNSKGETEGFWGVDHMGQVADFLGLERPGDKEQRALL